VCALTVANGMPDEVGPSGWWRPRDIQPEDSMPSRGRSDFDDLNEPLSRPPAETAGPNRTWGVNRLGAGCKAQKKSLGGRLDQARKTFQSMRSR